MKENTVSETIIWMKILLRQDSKENESSKSFNAKRNDL